jgi:hypothetical protein
MKPVIAEILRTGVRHVPLLLRVERVVVQPGKAVSAEGSTGRRRRRSNTIHRLYLTDDELIVQALLLPELELVVNEGDQLQIHKYAVRKAARKEQNGHVVFFGIEDCDNLTRLRPDTAAPAVEEEEGGFIREPSSATFTSAQPSTRKRSASCVSSEDFENTLLPPTKQPRLEPSLDIPSDDEMSTHGATQESEDDFEAFTPNANITQHRRQVLRELDPNRSSYFDALSSTKPKSSLPSEASARQPQITAAKPSASRSTIAGRPESITNVPHSIPIPSPSPPASLLAITPLSTLPSLDPSTPTTILGIITWTSPNLLRPSPAFPPKRHVKIHDISIGHLFSGVSLAVYIDAATFKPQRGTIALLQDVVVQRCGSGSGEVNECFMLNAYANLPAKLAEKQKKGLDGVGDGGGDGGSSGEGKWFIDDKDQLLALGLEAEMDELRTWWLEREAKRAGTAARSTQIATTRT